MCNWQPHWAECELTSPRIWSKAKNPSELRKAYRLAPEHAPRCHVKAAHYLYVKGRLDLAIVALQEAIRLNPNLVQAHFLLGIIHQELGEKNLAFAAYRAGLATRNDFGGILPLALESTGTPEDVTAAYRDHQSFDGE